MKKFTKLAAIAVGIASLFLMSCNNAVTVDATVSGIEEKEFPLTINVTSDSELIDFEEEDESSDSRSILPDAHKASTLKFYLCSKEITTSAATAYGTPVQVTFKPTEAGNEKEGSVVINLSKANYNFELFAILASDTSTISSEADAKAAAVLWATASADLRYGDSVSFFLTSNGLTKTGKVDLTLYAQGWDPDDYTGYSITAQIEYTKATEVSGSTKIIGDVVGSTKTTIISAADASTSKISSQIKSTASSSYEYKQDALTPGTYLFEVIFTKGGKNFVWNDNITVLPGQTTTADVGITPTIDLVPNKPSSFKAGYVDNLNSEYYKLEFTWDGSDIKNESYYKIELLEVPSGVAQDYLKQPTAATAAEVAGTTNVCWDTLKTASGGSDAIDTVYGTDFVGDENVYIDGSLGKNNYTAIFRAAYGKRYAARICANNEVGDSEWTYCTIATDIAANNTTKAIAATGFKSTLINRYKISYNLSDGTLKDASDNSVETTYGCSQAFVTDTTDATKTSKYWEYITADDGSQSQRYITYSGGVEIMNPNGDYDFVYDKNGTATTVTKPTLYYKTSSRPWTNWTKDGSNWNEIGSRAKPYDGFENLNLVANYATVASVTIFDDNDYNIASVARTGGFTADDSIGHYYITLGQVENPTDVWTIKSPAGVRYDYVTVTLYRTNNKADYYNAKVVSSYDSSSKVTTYTATLNVKEYKTGIYRAEICAYSPIRPNDPYTAQIGVTIVDTTSSSTNADPAGTLTLNTADSTAIAATYTAASGEPSTSTIKIYQMPASASVASIDGATLVATSPSTYNASAALGTYKYFAVVDLGAGYNLKYTALTSITGTVYAISGTPTLSSDGNNPAVLTADASTLTATKSVGGVADGSYSATWTYSWTYSSDGTTYSSTLPAGATASGATLTTTATTANGYYKCTVTLSDDTEKTAETTAVQVTNS